MQGYTYPPVFTVDAAGGFQRQHQAAGIEPPPIPCWTFPPAQVRVKKSSRVTNSAGCLLIMVLLTIFAAMGLGAYQIRKLQTELLQMKEEMPPQTESNMPQKQIGYQQDYIRETKHEPAAHLMGQSQDNKSKTLKWESRHGRAFTVGVLYRDGGLQVNDTGLYFVYSRVQFLSRACKPRDSLNHIVYIKRGERVIKLMNDHREGFCQVSKNELWAAGSHLGSIHQLRQYDWVFVNVSEPTRLSSDHQSNYFGLFKLP
ncbi:tumor necrosis factor ligand superfamily member 6 [Silurus asotus]|uniref:Tumor necrosis factor ligand superfamily member 6 n=1 Tax=Silurus asotus TaxID=30991 RepID=A0AAD5AX03_SILAS|nr:tumor necrosis factor ligand superfamily member 6 [Silurus asotus]